jgi:hypothetical protein
LAAIASPDSNAASTESLAMGRTAALSLSIED